MVTNIIGYVIGIITTVLSVVGAVSGLYSLHSQKKLEKRLKRKEKFREVGEKLKTIENDLHRFFDEMVFRDMDVETEFTEFLPMLLIKAYYNTKQNILLFNLELYYELEKQKNIKVLDNIDEAISALKSFKSIRLKISGPDFIYDYGILFRSLTNALKKINQITEEEKEIISEFDPKLLSKLEKLILDCAEIILGSLIINKQITIDFSKFKTSEELGKKLFKRIIGYEKLQPKLKEFEQVLKELEELRKDLLKVSYS